MSLIERGAKLAAAATRVVRAEHSHLDSFKALMARDRTVRESVDMAHYGLSRLNWKPECKPLAERYNAQVKAGNDELGKIRDQMEALSRETGLSLQGLRDAVQLRDAVNSPRLPVTTR